VLISLTSPSILTLKFSQHYRQLGLCLCKYGLKPQAAFQVWCPPAVSTVHSTVNSLHQHDNTKVLRMDVYFDAPSCTKTRAHLELQTNWSNVLLLMIVVQHRRDKTESKWWTEWQMTHNKKKKGIQRHLYCINGSQNVQLQFTGRTLIESRDADGGGCCSTAGVITKTEWRKACKAKMSLPPQLHITLPLLLMPHQNCQPVLKHKHGTYHTPVFLSVNSSPTHRKAKGE